MFKHIIFLMPVVLMLSGGLPTAFAAESRAIKADEIRNVRKAPPTKTQINTQPIETLKPDLTITDMSITPATPKKGQTVIFTAKVLNKGAVNSPWHQATIRVGGDPNSPPNAIQVLAPNASAQIIRQMTINTAGRFRVTFIADKNGTVAEMNENNNSKYLEFTVEDRLPDLIIKDPKYSPANPKVGDTIQMEATTQNIGDIMAGYHHVGVRIGGESEPTVFGSVGHMDVGPPHGFFRQWHPTQPGTYVVRLYIDVNDEVEEHLENNNMVSMTITVAP
jgi:subtilase family serine protease